MVSPLRQRNALTIVAEHVQNLDGVLGNTNNFVAPVDDVAFFSDEHVFALGQEYAFSAAGRSGESVKRQVDWRRGLRWRRTLRDGLLVQHWSLDDMRWLDEHSEYVPAGSFVFGVFTLFQQIKTEAGIHGAQSGVLPGPRFCSHGVSRCRRGTKSGVSRARSCRSSCARRHAAEK